MSSLGKIIASVGIIVSGFGISYTEIGLIQKDLSEIRYIKGQTNLFIERDKLDESIETLEEFISKRGDYSAEFVASENIEHGRLIDEKERINQNIKPFQDEVDRYNSSITNRALISLGAIPFMLLGFYIYARK
ncbi:hypothetical protein COU57_06675 [Candidatus Pacearchaeota archaeon CG10_big_fil_rev_8_21_14_0_10_32_14]|nr:MAG: hypothetical protein COU57_06675 [Candidatus Pacearchaeota archaeon CG10_big_fil_rev_8_21_14_0_10_32_14]